MAKVIKEQIKKTSSLFLIISLILNFTVYGLMFNLNIDQIQNAKIGLTKEVSAAGTASTTLTVKNSPPGLSSTTPYESQISSSTSPINVGWSISFNLPNNAVSDQESNDFRLIICSGSSNATITPAQAISCIGGTELCHSGYASSTQTVSSSTSCTYNNVADPGAESRTWQAYVCDNHSSQPGCSQVGYGQGDSGSPFYINHPTTVTSATTSVNNINPGQAFTVSATTSDTDTLRGIDISGIVVCATSSFSTTTNSCQGVTYCTSTLSASASHSCATTTSAPLPHGNYTYQVYAVDWQSFSSTSKQAGSYDVNDVAPYIGAGNITLNNNTNIGLNAKLAGDKIVYATTTVTDDNGCADIVSATSTLYESATAGGGNCAPDDNNCYATSTGCVKLPGCSGIIAKFVCTFGLKYHAQPTDSANANTRGGDVWTNSTRVFDGSNSVVATNTTESVDVIQSAALDITETFIDYGVLVTGTTTGAYNATTTVNNYGNTPIDSQVYGTDMTRTLGGTIAVNNQKFGNAYATYSALPMSLSTGPAQLVTLDVFRPTSQTATTKGIYWGINVPLGLASGDYGGINTFQVAVNGSGVGW
jgi:hypothetical protein